MIKALKAWTANRYYPAVRYQQIAMDGFMVIIFFGFILPLLFIVWRFVWRLALGIEV